MAVLRASKFNGSDLARITPEGWNQKPNVLQIHHSLRQPRVANACGMNNGGCSHLCLPAPQFAGYGLANPAVVKSNGLTLKEQSAKSLKKRANKNKEAMARVRRSPKFVPKDMTQEYEALKEKHRPVDEKMFTCACPDGLELVGTSQCYRDGEPVYSASYVGSATSDEHHDSIGHDEQVVDEKGPAVGRNNVNDDDDGGNELLVLGASAGRSVLARPDGHQSGGLSAGYIVLIVLFTVLVTGAVVSMVSTSRSLSLEPRFQKLSFFFM
jgi:hypothetical protein